jgi:hypothetical protein
MNKYNRVVHEQLFNEWPTKDIFDLKYHIEAKDTQNSHDVRTLEVIKVVLSKRA